MAAPAQAEVLIVLPTVWPLVFTLAAGLAGCAWGGGGAAFFSAGRSITCFGSGWRAAGAAGTLFDDTALTAMMTSINWLRRSFYPGLDNYFPHGIKMFGQIASLL